MVKAILEKFPSTVNFDEVKNDEGKNLVLLAVEKRQSEVYEFLCKNLRLTRSLFKQVDNEGNSALHLAARYGGDRDWKFPGEVLIMQWEYKWLEYVRNSMPPGVFATYNYKFETPDEIFKETHKDLSTKDEEWLSKTSGACSVVATLIATVAFATAATVPGSLDKGLPVFLHNPVFQFFVAMSLTALMFSLLATILFLSIVTARYHTIQFYIDLPFALFLGMSAMFISILCMWVSFCAGHSFLMVHPARKVYLLIYIITSIPGTIFGITKFPVYFNLLTTSFYKTPASSYRIVPARPKPPENNKKDGCANLLSKVVTICEDNEK
ncbi:hypothetical protein K1719_018358 [Acacia pycnantha]|nr:hypothetical protein K1719_018358 [Acacia pycnantha]